MLDTISKDEAGHSGSEKVYSLSEQRKRKVPSLQQMLREDKELRFLFRFIDRYELREKALELLNVKAGLKV